MKQAHQRKTKEYITDIHVEKNAQTANNLAVALRTVFAY
jgi:hypothetical protein